MRVDERDLGGFFLGEDKQVWELVSYCEEPTATFKRLKDGEYLGGAVSSPNVQGFKRLVVRGEALITLRDMGGKHGSC